MTIKSKELSDSLQYFSLQNSSKHIITLSLTANNSSWDLIDSENLTVSSLVNNYIGNNSLLQYATNDTFSNRTQVSDKPRSSTEIPIWLIPCYSIILIFAVVGNVLVASTLFQNRRMRTITNVFLANLAISDMLLGVLCMPITLVGTYLRHFIFGELVCKFIQFAQAASVAVSSWTLVAISCERYYAICHPLRSRTWQTIHHAYKIIGCIWFGSVVCMAPIAIFSQLIPTSRQGLRKCREQWPEEAVGYERFYNIFLDLVLLVLPLVILCVAYILITRTLYMGIKDEKALIFGSKNNNVTNSSSGSVATGDAKIYTQIEAEMKQPTVFHLNMSFRYHTRKSNVIGGCVNHVETMQMDETATHNGQEAKYFTSTGVENKYSAMGSISSAATRTCRKGLRCSSPTITQAETEISVQKTKEQSNNPQNESSSSLQQCRNDDVKLITGPDASETTTTMATAKTCKLTIKSTDSHPPPLYCVRNNIEARKKTPDIASTSCFSINTSPAANCSRIQQQKQPNGNENQQHFHQISNNQQDDQLMQLHQQQQTTELAEKRKLNAVPSLRITEYALRRSNLKKNLESKKRVVKMLFVLVLEFFICWTPLYVINTMAMFIGPSIYEYVNYTTISFFQLLAYSSSCCNPITYCFMNASFRRAFVDTFRGMHLKGGRFWHKRSKTATNLSMAGNSCTVVTANTVLESPRL